MNCKRGDVAVIVKSAAGNEGKVVTCLEFVGSDVPGCKVHANDFWRIDTPIRCMDSLGRPGTEFVPYARDYCLRPLRSSDKVDEMIIIAGLPKHIKKENV